AQAVPLQGKTTLGFRYQNWSELGSGSDGKIIARLDIAAVTRHIALVGPHCSRPAYPRHIAQALQLARSPGRGLLAICLNLHKPFVWWRDCNSGFRQPPGELS